MKKIILLFLLYFCCHLSGMANDSTKLIYKINIKQEIGSAAWHHLQNGLYHANQQNADYILLEMNTYGGTVVEADSMRTAILNTKIPVYVFINNNAASAGALIAIACDRIYMRESANIGAATVVDMAGEKAPDKYQSYMRSLIRSTAESHGKDTIIQQNGDTIYKWKRDPIIAEAMVDERVVVPMLDDSTKVLTLTANEAIKVGYCDGIAENIDEVIVKYMGVDDYKIETYNPTWFDRIKDILTHGVVQSILIMLIMGGIYMEMKTPSIGFPSAIAITGAILYFAPLYMDGYAQNWEILLFVVGLILIAFEVFVIPGFGVAGISGITLVVAGLFLSLIGNIDFNFEGVSSDQAVKSLLTVSIGIAMSFILIVFLISRIGKENSMFKTVALTADQEGFSSVPEEQRHLIGQVGVAATILRPAGKVIIGSDYYDAVALQSYIDKGKKVKVTKYENSQLYVVEIKE
ncbi:MAG: NfeD family protein [Dysgonomonas sp.]|nr:NfeD family protein [Dysgonomonas sp.]